MEIIKGPAAGTIYGTEAANGVIQIITKRGRGEHPQFAFTTRQGTDWFMDAAGRWPTNFAKDASGTILSWNAVQAENARGTPMFQTGRLQNYNLSLSGTSGLVQYFVSGAYDHDTGIQPTNRLSRYSGRGNFGFSARPDLDFRVSTTFIKSDLALGLDNGRSPFFDGLFGTPLAVGTFRRGFFFAPPEVYYGGMFEALQNVDRFTGSMQLDHRVGSWFTHQGKVGIDQTTEDNVGRVNYAPENAQYFGVQFAKGNVNDTRRNITYITLDYNASAKFTLPKTIASTSSFGTQVYRRNTDSLVASGTEFPAPGVKSVSGAAVRTGQQNYLTNTTVGFYVQQQFAWNNRLFLTGALREDNNSAFGQNFDLAIYPKVSASWVVSDESFWKLRALNALKLRAAYGTSGQQPEAFAALRTYLPTTGPGDVAAVTPQFVGNPDLKPERAQELEAGFEAGLFDRIGIDFTYYNKKTRDAILLKSVPPSLGFPSQQFVNIGATSNRGMELALNAQALNRTNVAVDLNVSVARANDRVDDLGVLPEVVHTSVNSLQRSRVGMPIAAFYSKRFVSGDFDATGKVINALCEDGNGGTTSCATAPRVFIGTSTPKTTGAVSSTVTLWKKFRLYGLVDFKGGHRTLDYNRYARCNIIRVCEELVRPEKFGTRVAYETQNVAATDPQDIYIQDASFAKLREISLSFGLPARLARELRASRASLTLAGRNLHTWTDYTGMDPETRGSGPNPFFNYDQATTPQLAQFLATLNIAF
jgi:outer membrane receptor protein involved in Fe transport